jgi:hypothetical protein
MPRRAVSEGDLSAVQGVLYSTTGGGSDVKCESKGCGTVFVLNLKQNRIPCGRSANSIAPADFPAPRPPLRWCSI